MSDSSSSSSSPDSDSDLYSSLSDSSSSSSDDDEPSHAIKLIDSSSSDSVSTHVPVGLDVADVSNLMNDVDQIFQPFKKSHESSDPDRKPTALERRYQESVNSYTQMQDTKLVLAVCGARGSGSSELINNLAINQSLAQSLWGKLPLASLSGADRVTEAPTYLIHSEQHYINVVWRNTIVTSPTSPASSPCLKPDVKFNKNSDGEWYSECWKQVRQAHGNRDEVQHEVFLKCLKSASLSVHDQDQLLDLWSINQFLFSLSTWFGEHVAHIIRIEIGLSHWSFHKNITLIDMPGWTNEANAR